MGRLLLRGACRVGWLSGHQTQGYNSPVREVEEILERLRKSEFRSGIKLRQKELDYLNSKGMNTILKHASDFIGKRLAMAEPVNDGKQTPWRNHPVFVAQHATATCCRSCLQKWHEIGKGRELTAEEKQYVVAVIRGWLSQFGAPSTGESLSAEDQAQQANKSRLS